MEDVARRIQRGYGDLTGSERRLADLILGSPGMMVGFSLTELAGLVGVSKATVSRFVTKLGYASFNEFRHALRDGRNHVAGSPLHLMAHGLESTRGELDELVRQTLRLDLANLEATYAELSAAELDEAARLLAESAAVAFADFRKQFALAYYAATLFRTIRPGVRALPFLGASAVDGMLDVGPDDLVVMFPFRRPERDHEILSRAVRAAGATLVTIGDVWPNPAAERASIHFRCRTDNVGVFDSFVAPFSLINLLFTATANRLGSSAQTRLARLEEGHLLFDTFIDGARRRRSRS